MSTGSEALQILPEPDDGLSRLMRPPTDKQLAANRRNAKLSRGPRTKAGKALVRVNALKHGLMATVIPTSEMPAMINPEDYKELVASLMEDFAPRTQAEVSLIELLAVEILRVRRINELDLSLLEPPIMVSQPFRASTCMARSITDDLTQEQCDLLIREFTRLHDDVKSGLPPDIANEAIRYRIDFLLYFQIKNVAQHTQDIKAKLGEPETGKKEILRDSPEHMQIIMDRFGIASSEQIYEVLVSGKAIPHEYVEAWLQAIDWTRSTVKQTLEHRRHCEGLAQQARLQNTPQVVRNLPALALLSQYRVTANNLMLRYIKALNELRDRRAMEADYTDL